MRLIQQLAEEEVLRGSRGIGTETPNARTPESGSRGPAVDDVRNPARPTWYSTP